MKQFIPLDDIPRFRLTVERYNPKLRRPPLEFPYPVRDCGVGNNYEDGERLMLRGYMTDERCDLNCFALCEAFSAIRIVQ